MMYQREKILLILFTAVVGTFCLLETSVLLSAALARLKGNKKLCTLLIFSWPAKILHLLACLLFLCVIYGYFIEPYWLQVNRYDIYTDKIKDTTIRIVHITDIHCNKYIVNENKLARLINSMNPDVIVCTGDCINAFEGIPLFKQTMQALHARIGKYAVSGNVDVMFGCSNDIYEGTGFVQLRNDSVRLEKDGQPFYISGLGPEYSSIKSHRQLSAIPGRYYSVLLYHFPDLAEELAGLNVDLYLAGHTHGGQVVIPFYGPLITFSKFGTKYASGMYNLGDTTLYVNRGVGLEGGSWPKVRFLARPEIAVFDIKPADRHDNRR